MDFWGILGQATTSYIDVLTQQMIAEAEIGKIEAITALERAKLEAARVEAQRVAAEAPSWQKYLPWIALGGVAWFAFKKK